MNQADELFVRRYDDLETGLSASDDYELLKLAAGLRLLLLDDSPLMHQVNRKRRLKVRFRVNRVGSIADMPVKPDILFHAHGLDPSVFKIPTGIEELKIDDFLRHPLIEGAVTNVTIADAIRFGANKAGGVHYDLRRTPDEAKIEAVMAQLAGLGVHSLGIALQTITRIVLVALRPLREAIVKLPTALPLFAHYCLERGKAIQFDGLTQFLETNLSHELQEGFSWNAVIRVMQQQAPGERVFYEIGNPDRAPPLLTIKLEENGALVATAEVGLGRPLCARAEAFTRSPLFDHFVYVGVNLCMVAHRVDLTLSLNSTQVATDGMDGVLSTKLVSRHTIGSKLDGQDAAAFEIRELVIVDRCPTKEEHVQLAKYLWLQWHK